MGPATSVLDTTDVLVAGTADWTSRLGSSLDAVGAPPVSTTETIEATLEGVSTRAVDCIVTDYELADGTDPTPTPF